MLLCETTADEAVKQPWSLRRDNPAAIQLQWDPWACGWNCKMRSLCKRKRFKANHNQIQADKVQSQWWRIKLLWQNANSVKLLKANSTCSLGLTLKAKCRDPEDLQTAKCRWNGTAAGKYFANCFPVDKNGSEEIDQPMHPLARDWSRHNLNLASALSSPCADF